jgi:hypothetical protein
MKRLTMALVAFFLFVAVAQATLTPSKQRSIVDGPRPIAPKVEPNIPAEDDGGLVISDTTEVRLDGKVCELEEVPKTAEVVLLEIGKDKKSVLKIHFQTKK